MRRTCHEQPGYPFNGIKTIPSGQKKKKKATGKNKMGQCQLQIRKYSKKYERTDEVQIQRKLNLEQMLLRRCLQQKYFAGCRHGEMSICPPDRNIIWRKARMQE